MKKYLALLLAAIMALSLAACASTAKTEEPAAKLTMATEATFQPYEYYDGDAIVGIDVEVAQAIADKLGMELEVTDIAFDSIIPGVQTGKYDMGMAGMTVTDERKEQVNFSDSYATGVQVVIVKDDSPITSVDDLFADGASTVVGTQAGTTGFIYATSDIEDAGLGTVKSFGKTTDAVEALKNGQVDCVILDNEPAKALVAANEGLHILDTEYAVEDYAIAIAKENTDLLEKVNKALAELTADGTLQSIVDKYICIFATGRSDAPPRCFALYDFIEKRERFAHDRMVSGMDRKGRKGLCHLLHHQGSLEIYRKGSGQYAPDRAGRRAARYPDRHNRRHYPLDARQDA